jgi:hypothetical protein
MSLGYVEFVLDNSVMMTWCFPDESDSYADELSLRRGIPIATLDHKLRTAATALGVRLYQPT